jgi:hypothetical protein
MFSHLGYGDTLCSCSNSRYWHYYFIVIIFQVGKHMNTEHKMSLRNHKSSTYITEGVKKDAMQSAPIFISAWYFLNLRMEETWRV